MTQAESAVAALELLDWKRTIFGLYRDIRQKPPDQGWKQWRDTRDRLFTTHAQSPLPQNKRAAFQGVEYFDYDPEMRVVAEVRDEKPQSYEIPTSGDITMAFTRFGVAEFEVAATAVELELYWLDAYGGGIFLPFRDATSGTETYGAGRYLLDTVKGADLGMHEGGLVIDFNFAYNPSCAYDPQWVCPLAPPPNRLEMPIRAGEKVPAGPIGSN